MELLEACEKYKEIVDLSGVVLLARDGLGNEYELSSMDVAIVAGIITRNDLADIEKSMMLYGAIHSPCSTNFEKNNSKEG